MKPFNIYLTGVGGQGIGMISEIILRAGDYAGHPVKSVDTHGLAQRGGIVISHIRMGEGVYSPLIPNSEADLVVALERHEAMRGMNVALKDNGTLIYYDTVWQPLDVRRNLSDEISEKDIKNQCQSRNIREIKIYTPDLEDARMQNIALLSGISKNKLIPEIQEKHYIASMEDLMTESMLKKNRVLFKN